MTQTSAEIGMELVSASMGYVLAKLSEDPGWIVRLNPHVPLTSALEEDAAAFMLHRGQYMVQDIREAEH